MAMGNGARFSNLRTDYHAGQRFCCRRSQARHFLLIVIVAGHRGRGAARTSRLCCGEPEKRQHSRQFGNHLGNPGSIFILSFAVSFA